MSEELRGTGVLEQPAKKERTPEERERVRVAVAEHRKRKRELETNAKYNGNNEPTEPEAKRSFEQRGLRNEHVIDFCYQIALIAAEQKNILPNRFYFQNGLRKTLESYELEAPQILEAIPNEEVAGELLNRAELYALWDFGFWRQPEVTFEQWLADRLKFKMFDPELSKILGKEDFGVKHKEWTDFAPHWNPIGLPSNYTQRQALAWLDAQSEIKRYLLVASRNSMKSTWARILALTLTITYPDARILYVTETNKLSRKAMKEFRGYLEMAPNNPTLFHQYFGEYTIAPGSGQALTYDNPLARLGLPQHSVEQSSGESSNTGSRFDFAIFDDFVSRDYGTSNDEQKQAALAKHGSIMKLREPAGYALNIQTPWVTGDLGDVMIQRNNEDPEHPLAVRIDPVMTIHPEAMHKPLLELREEDVFLKFLPKLNWKFVREEMRSPEGVNFFRSQYLCEWIPDDDEDPKIHFEEATLRAAFMPREAAPRDGGAAFTVICGDLALTSNRTSDYSALVALRISPTPTGKWQMTVLDVEWGRYRMAELALKIVQFRRKFPECRSVYIERISGTELLQREVNQWALRYDINMTGTYWATPDVSKDAKQNRLLGLSILLEDSDRLLRFCNGHYMDELIGQFLRVASTRPNSQGDIRFRRIDIADAIAMGQRYLPAGPPDEQRHEDLEREQAGAARRQFHERMFGSAALDLQKANESAQQLQQLDERKVDPRLKWGGLPPGFRL